LVTRHHEAVPGQGFSHFLRLIYCLLHHTQRFSGLLLPLFGTGLFEMTRTGFEAMNAALRSRAEMTATVK
jgi:hypothetical protein